MALSPHSRGKILLSEAFDSMGINGTLMEGRGGGQGRMERRRKRVSVRKVVVL